MAGRIALTPWTHGCDGVVYHGRVFEGWQMRNLESDLRKIGQMEGNGE